MLFFYINYSNNVYNTMCKYRVIDMSQTESVTK